MEPSPDSSHELGGASASGNHGSLSAHSNSPFSDSLDGLKSLRNRNPRNAFLGCLNIDHLRNKIVELRCILREIGVEYNSISETKLDTSFANAQLKIDGYHSPPPPPPPPSSKKIETVMERVFIFIYFILYIMVFVKNDMIVSRLIEYEPQEIECICTKSTITKKHWLVFSVYRPPKAGNLDNFLFALHQTINKAMSKLKNIVIMGDMNIDTLEQSSGLTS